MTKVVGDKKTLAQYRKALPDNPSQGWVAERVSELTGEEIGQQAVSYWETGKVDLRNVHPRRLSAYAEVLHISIAELAEAAGYDPAELMLEGATRVNQPVGSIRSSERQLVAVHALAAAGAGVWTESAALEYIAVESWVAKRRHRVTFCVDGDSMAPTLNSGDYIHVDTDQLDVQEGKLYVLQVVGNGIVVKRARLFRGEMVLVSDNPLYPPLRPDEAKIIGRVFAVTPQTVRL